MKFPVRKEVEQFLPYEAGLSIDEIKEKYNLEKVVKLASNENPLGVSPKVKKVLQEKSELAFRYPQSGVPRLVKELAKYHNIDAKRIVVGNGSDEVIDLLIRVLGVAGSNNIVAFNPCFGIYTTQAMVCGVEFRQVDLNEDFSFDLDKLFNLVDEKTSIVFLTNPDNPTGYAIEAKYIAEFAKKLPKTCLLVVDEAYIDFAGTEYGCEKYLNDLDNIAIMRTFSKCYGLAGLRIGYGIFPEQIADYMCRIRLPFSLNILAEEAALAALGDRDFYLDTIKVSVEGREYLSEELSKLACKPYFSMSNFLLVYVENGKASELYNYLLEQGIILRYLKNYNLPDFIRVSVGNMEENSFLIQKVQEFFFPQNKPQVITIDGPAGVGKSTVAKKLAASYGYYMLDTGSMYRTLGIKLGAEAMDMTDEKLESELKKYTFSLKKNGNDYLLMCNDENVNSLPIRTDRASRLASVVSRNLLVRTYLQKYQKNLGAKYKLVADGRDMGTKVFPQSQCKIFLDASVEVRAKRRYDEYIAKGENCDFDTLIAEIQSRDMADRTREHDPLKAAPDALVIDTSHLSIEEVFKKVHDYAKEKLA